MRVAVYDGGRVKRREVVGRDCRRHLIALDRCDTQTEAGEGERIPTDAATEVGDPCESRVPKPCRMTGGNGQPRRLLQPVFGEEHSVGELTELRRGLCSQPTLQQHNAR